MRQSENRRSQEEERQGRRGDGQPAWSGQERGRDPQDDRGFMERAGDEVRSWFGDEEAARRRQLDDQRAFDGDPRRGFPGMMGAAEQGAPWQYGQYGPIGGFYPPPEYGYEPAGPWYGAPPGVMGPYGGAHNPMHSPQRPPYAPTRRLGGYSPYYGGWGDSPYYNQPYGGGAYGVSTSEARYGQPRGGPGFVPRTRERGRYYGRGPRGYQRPDERITEEINELLFRHPDIDASEIDVAVRSGEVTLSGHVEDRATKRVVEDLIEDLPGVREVQNQLRVGHGASVEAAASGPASVEKGRGKSTS